MVTLEDLTPGTAVRGIVPGRIVTIEAVKWIGDSVIEVTHKDSQGNLGNQLLYRDQEPSLEVVEQGRPWSFDGDGELLKLVSEAYRIRLAYLFDPLLAVHTSIIEPLPHQITAVYQEMLPRQPLRFLLADDPGAGKTIMAGLFIKELLIRGDLKRCLIVCPGNLVEQWQDELYRKFHLPFEIMTNEGLNAARTGNWFLETPLAICRLDKLSRNEDIKAKLETTDWDLVVCDEAHKMSASFFSGEVKATKRYNLGKLLSGVARHFLLLTATPHNGKEEDFQLFMALLDGDRFEGKFRDGVHVVDASDLMRRLVKEQLLKFDGRPLFPERRAYTVQYRLSAAEAHLYAEVTEYVKQEFNRADKLGDDSRKGTVGFALTILQRRLASSPEAIYQSLRRRRERLEKRLREEELLKRGAEVALTPGAKARELTEEDLEELDDAPDAEVEALEDEVVDLATAAQTIAELKAEIDTLVRLEKLAQEVRRSGTDRKWDELSRLLQNKAEMFDAQGHRRKLVIFTEHRDTLKYLTQRIRTLLGQDEAVVNIQGGMLREERRKAQESFTQDKNVQILVATDAAGEGINLQRAHLMVNYDLPWNPNRLEQRFGRIHRIGQTEVCHMWNLVADETREGDVYRKLLLKLEQEREALGGQVFDVLGQITFENRSLRSLLVEAIRYGDLPEVKARLERVIENALDYTKLKELIDSRALVRDAMDVAQVYKIREEMERAEARKLQPHFIQSFFLEAFRQLGGKIHERETKRFEITHVPGKVRDRDRLIGTGEPVLKSYERVTFEKNLMQVPGKPLASFLCPGHALMDAVVDLILERHRDLLRQGAVLVDPNDESRNVRALLYIEHAIQDARLNQSGGQRVVSKQMQFVEMDSEGRATKAGYAPYLDYRAPAEDELSVANPLLEQSWLSRNLETEALRYAVTQLVPAHIQEVRQRKEAMIDKTLEQVKARLTAEINYWDHRAQELKAQEAAGKQPRMNSQKAQERADELAARLRKRLEELEQERHISPAPPVVIGGVLVVPEGLLEELKGSDARAAAELAEEKKKVESAAMAAVMEAERRLGNEPRDVSSENCGYDIESVIPNGGGKLRFIEVKGRWADADTVTVTKNEILTALNKPDDFILALVKVDGEVAQVCYVRKPFTSPPDFGATSVNYRIDALMENAEEL
ncbi:MAG TPA: helicase-related protein [Candidatus Hydrogenedentes bacterium]|nr:helicase-related protein [Candidatus Hydrogenedentota bacterium]HQM51426.1 helicase-related protein [Candidatus Hydrogenedentota bacterium]